MNDFVKALYPAGLSDGDSFEEFSLCQLAEADLLNWREINSPAIEEEITRRAATIRAAHPIK